MRLKESPRQRSPREKPRDRAWQSILFAVPSADDIGLIEAEKVARIAGALEAQLELFHCAFDPGVAHPGESAPAHPEEDIQRLVSSAQQGLERIAERFRARALRVRTSVRWDHPVFEGIVRQVLRHGPALVIAWSGHHGRRAHFLPSQTDWKLIETCPCPLLLLKNPRPYSEPLVIAAVDPGDTHEEPPALAGRILDSAGILSNALSGTLEVFHARTPWDQAIRLDPQLRDLPEYGDEEIHRAYLTRIETRVLALAERHGIAREQIRIEDGLAAESLLRHADRRKADIVALGAGSRSRLHHVLAGDTAERVLDTLACDALIVKPPGFRTPVRRQSTHHVTSGRELETRLRW